MSIRISSLLRLRIFRSELKKSSRVSRFKGARGSARPGWVQKQHHGLEEIKVFRVSALTAQSKQAVDICCWLVLGSIPYPRPCKDMITRAVRQLGAACDSAAFSQIRV